MSDIIPRRIIQTYKSKDLPLSARAMTANLRMLNPDFEYLLFDDSQVEDFIDAEFPQYRAAVELFPMRIQRYDFFRYLAVFRLGGFYFDTDVILASSLDDLLGFGCVFSFEELSIYRYLSRSYGMDWEVGNYAFGATAGHPFLGAIIANCIRAQEDPEWVKPMLRTIPRIFRADYSVLATTGPGLVSRTLAEYPDACSQVKVLFPSDVLNKENWHCFGNHGIHLQAGSWRRGRGILFRMLHRVWESKTREARMRESIKQGRSREIQSRGGVRRTAKFEKGTA